MVIFAANLSMPVRYRQLIRAQTTRTGPLDTGLDERAVTAGGAAFQGLLALCSEFAKMRGLSAT